MALCNHEIVFDPALAPRNILRSYDTCYYVYFEQYTTEVNDSHIHRGIMALFDANFFVMKTKKKKKKRHFPLKEKGEKTVSHGCQAISICFIYLYVNILGRIVRRRIDAVRDGNPQHECTR